MNLQQASQAILGPVGATNTSGPIQYGPMFEEGAVAPREEPGTLDPTVSPTVAPPPPNGQPIVNGGAPQPNGQGAPWVKWALVAALAAGVGYGVYRVTQKESD